jgi:hypothetical protein
MKFTIGIALVILAVSSHAASLGSDDPTSSSLPIDVFAGDVHRILDIDADELAKKYTVFSLSLVLEGFNGDSFTRQVSIVDTFKGIQDESKYDYSGQSQAERKAAAQRAFDDFSKQHGKAIDVKATTLPESDKRMNQVEQVVYTFKTEKGYKPMIALGWSSSSYGNTIYYKLSVVEMHQKYE